MIGTVLKLYSIFSFFYRTFVTSISVESTYTWITTISLLHFKRGDFKRFQSPMLDCLVFTSEQKLINP
jgi:hypothetical protein